MAISGTFIADFAQFHTAVEQADVRLKGFESSSSKVETSLSRMSNSFSGTKVIQDATLMAEVFQRAGGSATFTSAELQRMGAVGAEAAAKMKAMGVDIPPGIQRIADESKKVQTTHTSMIGTLGEVAGAFGVAFSIARVAAFATESINAAAALHNLSRATGIATDDLQRLGYVGAGFGIDIHTMATGVETFSEKLGSGDAGATRAVQMLGLSVKDLIAAGPKEAFLQFADAAGHVDDKMTQAAIGADGFGSKLFKVLLPSLGELRTQMNEVPTHALISKETIQAADGFNTGLSHLTTTAKAWVATTLAYQPQWWVEGFQAWGDLVKGTTTPVHLLGVEVDTLAAHQLRLKATQDTVITSADALANRLKAMRVDALVPLSAADKDTILEFQRMGDNLEQLAKDVDKPVAAVRLFIEAHKDQEVAATKAAVAEAAAAKHTAEVMGGAVLATTKLWDEYYAQLVAHGGTANQIAIAEIDRWADDLTAQMVKAGTATTTFYDGLAALSKEKLAGVGLDWAFLGAHSRATLEETARNALKTYDYMAARATEFTRRDLEEQLQKVRETAAAARGLGKDFVDAEHAAAFATANTNEKLAEQAAAAEKIAAANRAMGNATQIDVSTQAGRDKVDPAIARWLHDGYSLEQSSSIAYTLAWGGQINQNDPLFRTKGPRVPGFASGVENFAGGAAWVGEKGPELVTLPAGANVAPSGSAGAGGHTVNNFSFYVDGTSDVAARKIMDYIIRTLKQGRQFGAA